MAQIFYIDPIYIRYRNLWKNDRWKFSGDYVKLNIKSDKVGLDRAEEKVLETMERVIEENGGRWTEGYSFEAESIKARIDFNKNKQKK